MEKKIYIVKSSSGEYEDYYTINEKAFLSKEKAEQYVKQITDEINKKPSFLTEDIATLIDEAYIETPDWEDYSGEVPINTDERRKDYFAWQEEMTKRDNEFIISYAAERGITLTTEMIQEYDLYKSWIQDNVTYDIEELDLIE